MRAKWAKPWAVRKLLFLNFNKTQLINAALFHKVHKLCDLDQTFEHAATGIARLIFLSRENIQFHFLFQLSAGCLSFCHFIRRMSLVPLLIWRWQCKMRTSSSASCTATACCGSDICWTIWRKMGTQPGIWNCKAPSISLQYAEVLCRVWREKASSESARTDSERAFPAFHMCVEIANPATEQRRSSCELLACVVRHSRSKLEVDIKIKRRKQWKGKPRTWFLQRRKWVKSSYARILAAARLLRSVAAERAKRGWERAVKGESLRDRKSVV